MREECKGSRWKSLALLLVFLTFEWSAVANGPEYHFRLPHASQILRITPGPNNALVFVVFGNQEESEELSFGTPGIVNLATSKLIPLPKLETFQIDASAAWKKDGHVLVETTNGIIEIDSAQPDKDKKVIVGGETHGLALSSDESKIAYWRVNGATWDLNVRELASSKILRKWKLPYAYGGEANGFEIAFGDDKTVYARTFDSSRGTPLKSFEIDSGKMVAIERDCGGLAAANSAIYYIVSSRSGRLFKKLVKGSAQVVFPILGYHELQTAPGRNWIVLFGEGKSALVDVASERIVEKSPCENMTVLADGTRLYIKDGTLSSNPALCSGRR